MRLEVPRMRMFAGPNGSDKSTIKDVLNPNLVGVYVNPDEIEKEIAKYDFLDLDWYNIESTEDEILPFFQNSTLLEKAELDEEAQWLKFNDNKLSFFEVGINSYFASVCADFIRKKLLEKRISFTFETVMSSPDKVELLKLAQKLGFRTYLYYVSTNDPEINISRVEDRVYKGGHPVPKDKIVSRYYRSLDYLTNAISHTNRTYIFDNSSHKHTWLCEITEASEIDMKSDSYPQWFSKYVIEKYQV